MGKLKRMTIVIVAVPYVETNEPIMAPGLLKGVLAQHQIDSIAVDLNIEIVNQIDCHANKQKILDFFFSQIIHPEVVDDLVSLVDYCVERLAKDRPTLVALSLLTYQCQIFTAWICSALKQQIPNVQIVIGGPGIKNFIMDRNTHFCDEIRRMGLVDDYITGDGDIAFYEYVKGNRTYPGINSPSWHAVTNLNSVACPDYSDYDFSQYNFLTIPINDSRGCVKNCEFCDIIEFWEKFQFRSADNIFQEMLLQISKYNITHFGFRNSLTNGNLKEFKKLLDLICDYNQNHQPQISWSGYFIIRQPSQHPDELWSKIGQSNGRLFLGVESVIGQVRHQMGKTFENSDIDYHLEMGQRHKVPLMLLIIVAYPTENLNDYEFTKQWFRERKQYANNSVDTVLLSFASVLPGTQLEKKSTQYNLKVGNLPSIWINQQLNITTDQRKKYLTELQDICINECNFNVPINDAETLEHSINVH